MRTPPFSQATDLNTASGDTLSPLLARPLRSRHLINMQKRAIGVLRGLGTRLSRATTRKALGTRLAYLFRVPGHSHPRSQGLTADTALPREALGPRMGHSRTQSPSYARCDEGLWPNPKPETIKTW